MPSSQEECLDLQVSSSMSVTFLSLYLFVFCFIFGTDFWDRDISVSILCLNAEVFYSSFIFTFMFLSGYDFLFEDSSFFLFLLLPLSSWISSTGI